MKRLPIVLILISLLVSNSLSSKTVGLSYFSNVNIFNHDALSKEERTDHFNFNTYCKTNLLPSRQHNLFTQTKRRNKNNATTTCTPTNKPYRFVNLVGTSKSGTTITKTSETSWMNAGGTTNQTLSEGDYITYKVAAGKSVAVGLSSIDQDCSFTTIENCMYTRFDNKIYIYENGESKLLSAVSYTSSSLLKILIEGGKIKYYCNGTLLYQRTAPLTSSELVVDFSMYSQDSQIIDLQIYKSCSSGDADNDGVCDAVDQCPGKDDSIDVNQNGIPDGCDIATTDRITSYSLTNSSGISTLQSGASITKTISKTVATGWGNSGGSTNLTIEDGGFLIYKVKNNVSAMMGLSVQDSDKNFASIGNGLYTRYDNKIYVYEMGVNKSGIIKGYTEQSVFKISYQGGRVNYFCDGNLIYVSSTAYTNASLVVDFSIYDATAQIIDLQLFENCQTNTIVLASGSGAKDQEVVNTSTLSTITYNTTGATGATVTGLPTGVSGAFSSNHVTISGTPTQAGTFNYSVTLTGGCGTVSSTGTITVHPLNTITLSSLEGTNNQELEINNSLTSIVYDVVGATGADISGLPAGITGAFNATTHQVTIGGTPTQVGAYDYTITLTGGYGTVAANGTITILPVLSSTEGTNNQEVIADSELTDITYNITGATEVTVTDLPEGVSYTYTNSLLRIKGTPSAPGSFTYTVIIRGGVRTVIKTGSITVRPLNTIVLTSAVGTNNQTSCINVPIVSITYTTTGARSVLVTGLPAGVTKTFSSNTLTISGIPEQTGIFPYKIILGGGYGDVSTTGTITIKPNSSIVLSSQSDTNYQTLDINTPLTNIVYNTFDTNAVTVTGLPTGVNGVNSNGIVTISGSPTVLGTFPYTVNAAGDCLTTYESGIITVNSTGGTATNGTTTASGTIVNTGNSQLQSFADTKGELQISGSGTATYKVPIALPPGIKDVAPQLALVYNGSSVQGMAGMGWNLTGISSISRTSSRIDLDGVLDGVDFDNLDRFALDGQRLIKKIGDYGAPGTTYQTENYTNLKIESAGSFDYLGLTNNTSPQSFTVTFVDGSKAYYGGTEDSRGLLNWMINRWIDPQGNYIDYTYETENNTQRIKKISWGNNINVPSNYENKIEFKYNPRVRTEYSYLNFNNIKIEVNKILSEISVSTGGELFRKYTIDHDTISGNYQRVRSITESNGANEAANPIVFDYENTANGFAQIVKYNGVTESDLVNVKLSGDFDGNGEQDFIADDKVYLNPIDNNNDWKGISLTPWDNRFTAITLTNNKLNQFQSIVQVEKGLNHLSFGIFNVNPKAAPYTSGIYLANTKTINIDNTIYHNTYFDRNEISYSSNFNRDNPPTCFPPINKTDNEYLEGDYNGDGISEVLILNKSNEYYYNVTTKNFYQPTPYDENQEPFFISCETIKNDEGTDVYLLDLNPNASTTLGEKGFVKLPYITIWNDCQKNIIDFNGDGKSDIIFINPNKTYTVIGFKQLTAAPWVEIELLASGTFESYNKGYQIVFGDFNGDSKTDIMIPEANGSSSWFLYESTGSGFEQISYPNFELYQPYDIRDGQTFWPHEYGTLIPLKQNFQTYKTYRAADLDKDGKSDFIVNTYETFCVDYGLSGCDRDATAFLSYKKNLGNLVSKPFFASNIATPKIYSEYGYETPIDLLLGNYRNHSAYSNFVFIQGKQVWKGNFNKDISKEATLTQVTEAGGAIVQNISYKKLVPSSGLGTADDIYYSTGSENYPFTELARVPTMYVVDQLTATANNQTKKQQFKYFGLVTHSKGLGVLGFKKVARSSWFNEQNTDKIWSISVTSPQFNGAIIREFTSRSSSIANPIMEGILNPTASEPQTDNATIENYLTRKDYSYTKIDKGNDVTALRVTKTSTKDVISGTYSYTLFDEYDAFENVTKNTTNNGIATTTVTNTVLNNATATDNKYCIGKLLQKKESVTAYGDTFTSEEVYIYDTAIPNQVKQSQTKGHNTEYVNTEYEYDEFGNVTSKTISAPLVSSRKITDIYDANGRFVSKKTDNEGHETTFEYNKLGQQTKSKNYLNVETISSYDNWGKLQTTTVTGASSITQKQFYKYVRDTNGYYVTTTGNTPGDFSRVFYDVFGREVKTTKLGFATNTYISKSVEYDFLGRKAKESEPYLDSSPTLATGDFSKSNSITYDYLSRPSTQSLYTGKQISIIYEGLTSTTADGTKTVTTTMDANGNKIEETTNGEKLNFTYYANGNLKETIYGNHTITMQYDGWGRQTYMLDPSVSTTAYTKTYNNYGELLTDVTPTGTTTIEYFATGKLKKKTQAGQSTNQVTTYEYNSKGFLKSETGTINGKNFAYYPIYDAYNRIRTNTEVTPDNLTHKKTISYDGYGRVQLENTYSYQTNNPTVNNGNTTIEYGYNSYNGVIDQYKDANTNVVLWKLKTANEKMQALTASLGNGMQITNVYDNVGYFETAHHASSNSTALNLEYDFNATRGILNYRKNNIAGVLSWNENFEYDDEDRLKLWTDPTGTTTASYETDGRIKNNDQVGTYNYEDSNRYRKKSATLNEAGFSFYNSRSLQEVSYDMFKNPITITEKDRGKVDFEYNLSNSRSKSVVTNEEGEVTKTKYYSGITAVEVIERPNQSLQFITYIAGSPYDAVVALEKTYTNSGGSYTPSTQEYLYLHRDYQGTILAISGNGGIIKERRQFDAWGNLKKYFKNEVETLPTAFANVDFEFLTDRGYTGHEHFFSVGIIHMNARLYDPVLHTFLSPDANITDPSNPQNYNRYAYALNNPLMFTDYSGNDPVTVAIVTAAIIGAAIGGVVYVGINLYNGTAITWGGLVKSILVGAISGAASGGIGQIINSASTAICAAMPTLTQTQINLMLAIPQALMHGIAQGFIQGVSGGNLEQSFLTAAISSIAGSGFGMTGSFGRSIGGQSLFGAVAGGITSRLQGGNFWEGAVIGLTVGLLNHAGNKLYPAIDRMINGTRIAGIYGFGPEDNSSNPAIESIVLKRGGKMFTSSFGGGDDEIIAYLKAGFELGKRLIIYGYSRGGAAAVRIANVLGAMHINVSEMYLYDPVALFGGGSFTFNYPNVMKVNNYYQRNPTDHVYQAWEGNLANNPFQGSPVSGNFQWPVIKNVNYTGNLSVNHINIVNYAATHP